MAAKGKTMADSGYNSEVKSIQAFLSMQHPASQPVINPATLDIQIEEYVAPRFFRKMRSKVRKKTLASCGSGPVTITSFSFSCDTRFWRRTRTLRT